MPSLTSAAEDSWIADATPPDISVASPTNKAHYVLNESVTPSYSCSDPLSGDPPVASGIATCTDDGFSTSTLGSFLFTVSATDNAGNASSKTIAYVIDPPRYADFLLEEDPIAYYRLNEAVGSAPMLDFSGNDHDGEYKNGIVLRRTAAPTCERRPHPPHACALKNDPQDYAAYFPPRDGYAYTNGITAPTDEYSLEAWVNPADGADMMIAAHGGGGQIFISGGRLALRQTQDTIVAPGPAGEVPPGTWTHVAASWDGHTSRLYVDGAEVASSTSANKAPSGTATFYVGYGDQAPWFHGHLDEVAYYDRALDPDSFFDHWEIGSAYDHPSPTGPGSSQTGPENTNTALPYANTEVPVNKATYAPTKVPDSDFSCSDLDGPGDIASCTATIDGNPITDGAPLPETLGTHEFTLTAIDQGGNTYIHTHTFTVMPYADVVRFDSPLAYYRLDDGEGAETMVDDTGFHDGAYKNDQDSGPAGISGDGNHARDFFGAGGYGYVNGIAAPRYQSTLEAWVKPLGSPDPVSTGFGGGSLPAGWSVHNVWQAGGSAVVSGGELVVDGASAGTDATFGSGRTLDFRATFPHEVFTHGGFGEDYNNAPWAMFSVKGDGELYARSDNGAGESLETHLGAGYLGSSHRYRIEWRPDRVIYYVDGDVVASHPLGWGATSMRPLFSNFDSGGQALRVDWVRMSPYSHRDQSILGHGDAGEIYIKDAHFVFRHMDTKVTSAALVKPGEWQQVVGTWDGVDIRIYVDGVESGQAEATKQPTSVSTFYVGFGELAPWFAGSIDEAAYFDTVLSAERVYEHYIADPPPDVSAGDSGSGGGSDESGATGSSDAGSGSVAPAGTPPAGPTAAVAASGQRVQPSWGTGKGKQGRAVRRGKKCKKCKKAKKCMKAKKAKKCKKSGSGRYSRHGGGKRDHR